MVKIVYAFFYAISLLPFRLLYCIADFEYFMMYYVIKYRRGIVRKNLTTSFPEKSEEEIVDIEKKFYRWFSDYSPNPARGWPVSWRGTVIRCMWRICAGEARARRPSPSGLATASMS